MCGCVSLCRAPAPQRAPYSRRRPSLLVAEREGASRRRRESRVGTICWRCFGQNTQWSVISARADRLQVGGLPEFVRARSSGVGECRIGWAGGQQVNPAMQPLQLPSIKPPQSGMRWPGAPACRSRRAPSGGSNRQRLRRRSPPVWAAHGPRERCFGLVDNEMVEQGARNTASGALLAP